MTQQDDITQPVLTDEKILRAAINASDSLNITRVHELGGPSRTIMEDAGLLELGRAIESAVLSTLRAPVADERKTSTAGRDPIMHAVASLAAAISLLERTPTAKKAAASDMMFAQMLKDYRMALGNARAALASAPVAVGAQPVIHQHGFAADNQRLRAINESLDKQLEEVMAERDDFHDMADKLANAIAGHLPVEIGEHSRNCPWIRALEAIENAAPQASPVAVEVTDDDIRTIFLAHGFTIKEGQTDLKPYVYSAARALLAAHAALASTPMSEEPVYAYRRKGLDDFVTCDRERFDELSAKPRLFETRIFYAAPRASADDWPTPAQEREAERQWDAWAYEMNQCRNEALEKAAAWVDKRRQDFDHEHGYMEAGTGAWSFGTGAHAEAKAEYSAELGEIAEGLRALKQPQADKDGGQQRAGEPLGWRVRERRSDDGELLDCFVEAPAVPGMAYAQEVLGDDYAEAQGGIEGKLKHCQMIVAWANGERK